MRNNSFKKKLIVGVFCNMLFFSFLFCYSQVSSGFYLSYIDKGCNSCDSELGGVESDELNGIAHSNIYLFWSSNGSYGPELARTPRSSITSVDKNAWLPLDLRKKGYDHFGDIDFYGNYLYVPVDGDHPLFKVLVSA